LHAADSKRDCEKHYKKPQTILFHHSSPPINTSIGYGVTGQSGGNPDGKSGSRRNGSRATLKTAEKNSGYECRKFEL
jgi:hypothetical protein